MGLRNCMIAKYYKLHLSNVSRIFRKRRNAQSTKTEKRGRKRMLTPRSLPLFHKYVTQYCFEPLYVVPGYFYEAAGVKMSESISRRHIFKLSMDALLQYKSHFYRRRILASV